MTGEVVDLYMPTDVESTMMLRGPPFHARSTVNRAEVEVLGAKPFIAFKAFMIQDIPDDL